MTKLEKVKKAVRFLILLLLIPSPLLTMEGSTSDSTSSNDPNTPHYYLFDFCDDETHDAFLVCNSEELALLPTLKEMVTNLSNNHNFQEPISTGHTSYPHIIRIIEEALGFVVNEEYDELGDYLKQFYTINIFLLIEFSHYLNFKAVKNLCIKNLCIRAIRQSNDGSLSEAIDWIKKIPINCKLKNQSINLLIKALQEE